jgi:hypothetical protein
MAFERDLGSSYNLLESESAKPEDNGTGVDVARRSTIGLQPCPGADRRGLDLVDRARAVGREKDGNSL